jgi:hypothetical protein
MTMHWWEKNELNVYVTIYGLEKQENKTTCISQMYLFAATKGEACRCDDIY